MILFESEDDSNNTNDNNSDYNDNNNSSDGQLLNGWCSSACNLILD